VHARVLDTAKGPLWKGERIKHLIQAFKFFTGIFCRLDEGLLVLLKRKENYD